MDGSKATTFDGTRTDGIGGRIHTRPEAETGVALPDGGSADPATLTAHDPRPGPEPTVRVNFGVDPSGSSGAGSTLCSESSADTGSAVIRRSARPRVAGAAHPIRRIARRGPPASSSGASSWASANLPAQANTRLPRIAVLVQNSRVVGPIKTTESNATRTPKTNLPTW